MRPSMGSAGDCYDNALCESFFATLECELIDRRCFLTHKEARLAIFSYIEGWYNPHRRHSSIAHHAPIAYEKLHLSQAWNTRPKYSTEAMLLPNSKSVHTEPEFRPQTAIFPTANSLSTNGVTPGTTKPAISVLPPGERVEIPQEIIDRHDRLKSFLNQIVP